MSEMYRPQVRVIAPGGDHSDPLAQSYRVFMFRRVPEGVDTMTQDGRWQRTPDGEALHPEMGLRIPSEFVPALYEALGTSLGKTQPTNYDVLREWLAVERGRVDLVWGRYTDTGFTDG